MAEAAAAATIFGIAGFGIQLTQTLYSFGSNVASARESCNYIARHIDLYANVLDILTERINDDEPILSDAAFDLVDELKFQSNRLFRKIESLLPRPEQGKDGLSLFQKVKWNFTKSKMAHLVAELDYLRSTVQLLATIVFTGRKIRSRRRKAKSSKEDVDKIDSEVRKQSAKAHNALLTRHEALETLSELEKTAERQEDSDNQIKGQTSDQQPGHQTDLMVMHNTIFSDLQQSLAVYNDPAERQLVVFQQSPHLLQRLLQEWTTICTSDSEGTSQQIQPRSGLQERQTDTILEDASFSNASACNGSEHGSSTGHHNTDVPGKRASSDMKQTRNGVPPIHEKGKRSDLSKANEHLQPLPPTSLDPLSVPGSSFLTLPTSSPCSPTPTDTALPFVVPLSIPSLPSLPPNTAFQSPLMDTSSAIPAHGDLPTESLRTGLDSWRRAQQSSQYQSAMAAIDELMARGPTMTQEEGLNSVQHTEREKQPKSYHHTGLQKHLKSVHQKELEKGLKSVPQTQLSPLKSVNRTELQKHLKSVHHTELEKGLKSVPQPQLSPLKSVNRTKLLNADNSLRGCWSCNGKGLAFEEPKKHCVHCKGSGRVTSYDTLWGFQSPKRCQFCSGIGYKREPRLVGSCQICSPTGRRPDSRLPVGLHRTPITVAKPFRNPNMPTMGSLGSLL